MKPTIHVFFHAFLCSHMPDLAVNVTQQRSQPAVNLARRESSKPWAPICIVKLVALTAALAVSRRASTPRHHVPPSARRMALQAQAKHLGVLPRCHSAFTHAQRHRAQQTALRSVRLEVHPHPFWSDRRRVPEFLLQVHMLLRRPGRYVQASEGSGSCAEDYGKG